MENTSIPITTPNPGPMFVPIFRCEDTNSSNDIHIPSYQTCGSSCMDVHAAIDTPIIIKPHQRVLIPTGFSYEIPRNYEIQVRSRSGIAYKNGIIVFNSPGTIDEDYTGELKVLLINFSEDDFNVNRGDRIAQIVFNPVTKVILNLEPLRKKIKTNRGDGGFGSTGTK